MNFWHCYFIATALVHLNGNIHRNPAMRPSFAYAVEFLLHSVNLPLLGGLAALLGLAALANKFKIRLTLLSYIALFTLAITGPAVRSGSSIEEFYGEEARRYVRLEKIGTATSDFDIILIHGCSLSWDDLLASGAECKPFFDKFDYVFTKFNTDKSAR